MAGYVGTIGERITKDVILVNEYTYDTCFGWKYQTHHIYTMTDDEGHVYVWKTTSFLSIAGEDEDGNWQPYVIQRNDRIRIKASVKAHSEYREQEQTEIQRVKILDLVEKAITKEELEEAKRAEQLKSLQDGDFLWRMPYKQYKEHYADCETVVGSFDRDMYRGSTINVIIRKGRLKASGVRGEHFQGYEMTNEIGEHHVYRAVNEENALKRVNKEYPDHKWECTKIYNYERRSS